MSFAEVPKDKRSQVILVANQFERDASSTESLLIVLCFYIFFVNESKYFQQYEPDYHYYFHIIFFVDIFPSKSTNQCLAY